MSGRIRSIKPEVLEDEIAAGLSDAAWRLWVSLWTVADDFGNVRLGDRYLAASVWQDTNRDAATPRAELEERGFVTAYAVKGQRYGHIRGFRKHQRIDNAGKARVPGPEEDDGSWGTGPVSTRAPSVGPTSNQTLTASLADFSANPDPPPPGSPLACAGARAPSRPPTTTTTTTTDLALPLRAETFQEEPKPETKAQARKAAVIPHACPEDWAPTPSLLAWCATKGIGRTAALAQAERFVLWASECGKKRPGWNKSFQSWVLRSIDDGRLVPAEPEKTISQTRIAAVAAAEPGIPCPPEFRTALLEWAQPEVDPLLAGLDGNALGAR